jgi:hypothetical protein
VAQWRHAKHVKAAILAARASKGPRRKRTRPEPRQYTVAYLERAQDRVEAAERRIANDRTSNLNKSFWPLCRRREALQPRPGDKGERARRFTQAAIDFGWIATTRAPSFGDLLDQAMVDSRSRAQNRWAQEP